METDFATDRRARYFAPETIESVKVFNRRAIVTLVNAAEDAARAGELENALKERPEIDKVSVVYTSARREEGDNHWKIPGVKRLLRLLRAKAESENRPPRLTWRWRWPLSAKEWRCLMPIYTGRRFRPCSGLRAFRRFRTTGALLNRLKTSG